MSHWTRAVLLFILVLLGGPAGTAAQDQTVIVATRGPRFLVASSSAPAASMKAVQPEAVPTLRRRIAVDLDGVMLEHALAAIARLGKLQLVYSRSVLRLDTPVRLRATDISVAGALTVVLLNTGIDVLLKSNGQVVLVPRGGFTVGSGVVTGRVTDAGTGRPLRGADVTLKKTPFRTPTADSGTFRLAFDSLPAGEYILQVRMFGFRPAERALRIGDADTILVVDFALRSTPTQLDSLVTTATGQQRRRDLGNAITTIHADSVLQHAPIRNLTDLLEDRVPGLTVQHTTGAPGDPAKLRLRGLRSALRSNDPVVIVDGVRVYAAQSEARSGNLTNAFAADPLPAPSPLDQIDPNIIEKVEVFKGASAATLYGADAANGVIVITTKRGKPGPTRWTANFTHGRTALPSRYPTGYYRWGHDLGNGVLRFCTITDRLCVPDSLVQFQALNVPSLTIMGHGSRNGLSLTTSGGTQALTYSLTGTFGDETGFVELPAFEVERFRTLFNRDAPDWMRRPHHLKQWAVTSSINARLSQVADVALVTTLARSEQQRTSLEQQIAPLMGMYVDTINGLYYRPTPPGNAIFTQPAFGSLGGTSSILQDYYVRATASTITFTTGLNANWRPRSWFTATGHAGLNVVPRNDERFLPAGLTAPTDSGQLGRGTGRALTSTFDLLGSVRKTLGHGFLFETNLGANLTTASTADVVTNATGLIPGTTSITNATHVMASDASANTSVYGWYVEPRITGQRLSLSTGLRLDGGSAYGTRITGFGSGPGGRGFLRGLLALPKLNGSWVVSEEPWFPFNSLFSSLRLRGAYGQAQVQPGPADRLRLYTGTTDQLGTVSLTSLGNTQLRPERSTEFEGGFDADVLDSRVSVELTAYRTLQVDALMGVGLPSSVNGGGSVLKNIGNILNTGMELSVGLAPVRTSAMMWKMQLHYSRNRNKLTKLGTGVDPNPLEGLVAGYPVRSRWALPIVGFADENGDGVLQRWEIQVGDSMVYMGRLMPDYQMWYNTDLGLFGGAVTVSAGLSFDGGATQVDQRARDNWVLVRALVDPAAPLSEQAAVLAYQTLHLGNTSANPVTSPSTDYGLMQIVSTFRFNELSVNYRAPARVARLVGAQRLSVAVQGRNLGLHSTYRGRDPDVSAWSPGDNIVDNGQLAQPRTWQLRVDVEY